MAKLLQERGQGPFRPEILSEIENLSEVRVDGAKASVFPA